MFAGGGEHDRAVALDAGLRRGVGSVPGPMAPGDLLLPAARLLHRTTDDHSVVAHVALLQRVSAPPPAG